MGHGHSHRRNVDADETWINKDKQVLVHKFVLVFLIPLSFFGVLNLVVTWPDESQKLDFNTLGYVEQTEFYSATVKSLEHYDCIAIGAQMQADGNFESAICAKVSAKLTAGPNLGSVITFDADAEIMSFGIKAGDKVSVAAIVTETETIYIFVDFQRTNAVTYLFIITVVILLSITGLAGLRALIGLLITFAILGFYLIPTLVSGAGVVITLVTVFSAILAIVLYLVHGFSLKTAAAILGTLAGAAITLGSALIATQQLSLTGFTDEQDLVLTGVAPNVRLSMLLVASIVIGGIGALNDVTVTQSSAVWELASADERANWYSLFSGGMRVGRDHIASSIYTIAFAYVGSALITLMLILGSSQPFEVLINSEIIAQELTLIMLGAIGLSLSTPITTAIAAWFATLIRKNTEAN